MANSDGKSDESAAWDKESFVVWEAGQADGKTEDCLHVTDQTDRNTRPTSAHSDDDTDEPHSCGRSRINTPNPTHCGKCFL